MSNIIKKVREKGLKGSIIATKDKIGDIPKKLFIPIKLKRLLKNYGAKLASDLSIIDIRDRTLNYIESLRIKESNYGQYRYCKTQKKPVLYASIYAVLTRHLYKDLNTVSYNEKKEWINYIQSFQSDDGLFKDREVSNDISADSDWWGWRHLTLHAFMALACLGSTARRKLKVIHPFKNENFIVNWLESLDWIVDPATTSNQIQNYLVMLQYARDFHKEAWAENSLQATFKWLDDNQDRETGLWGKKFNSPLSLSMGVQTGYHIWLLYFYDKRPIQYIGKIIDSSLATQNKLGGFGVMINSSACEDIDSIDPLIRLSFLTSYRKLEVLLAIKKSILWILINMNKDGGFVFRRFEPFVYGHRLMSSTINESAMFPTWFRTLSLAYIAKVLPDFIVGEFDWQFVKCPGMQFW